MKKLLAHYTLILAIAVASVWSIQTYTSARASNSTPLRPAAAELSAVQQPVGELWNRTELFFGSLKPDGTVVSESKFQRFVDSEVTPRFPDGLTVLTGFGQFRNSLGVLLKERSMVLILLYPLDMPDADMKIEEIREAYKRAFQQESVLRVDSQANVSF